VCSSDLEDKVEGGGRMFIAKNRNGPDGIVFPMEIDTSRVKLRVLQPEAGSDLNSVVSRTQQEQKEHLQQKYQKYKNKKQKMQDTNNNQKAASSQLSGLNKEEFRKLAQKQANQQEQKETNVNV